MLVGTTLLLFDELHAELERLRYLLSLPQAARVLGRAAVARVAGSAAAATAALLAAQRAPRANGHP